MNHIYTLGGGLPTVGLFRQLQENPHLWNKDSSRTKNLNSPHHQVDDIWVRFGKGDVSNDAPHESEWLDAANVLTCAVTMAFNVMNIVLGERLGGILITRVPAGKQVLKHTDIGWHANYYKKYAVQIQATNKQAFCYADGRHVTQPGDLYTFDNSEPHWVTNDSDQDRITIIFCIKTF